LREVTELAGNLQLERGRNSMDRGCYIRNINDTHNSGFRTEKYPLG